MGLLLWAGFFSLSLWFKEALTKNGGAATYLVNIDFFLFMSIFESFLAMLSL
jgi:hypothetical protein